MADPKTRIVHTNWARYNCCDDHKPYQFRVTVELVGVNGSDPQTLSLYTLGELMVNGGEAMQEHYENTQERDYSEDDE